MPIVKTQQQAADAIGVSQPRFWKVSKRGGLDSAKVTVPGQKKHSWDTDKLKILWREITDPMHETRKMPQPEPGTKKQKATDDEKQEVIQEAGVKLTMNYNTAKTLNEQYKAARSKLAYEKEVGEVINAAAAEKKTFHIARQVRDACLAIPDRCTPLIAALNDQFQIKKVMMEEIKNILENLSNAVKNDSLTKM